SQPDQADREAEPARAERLDVLRDLIADDREVRQRRVDESVLEIRVVLRDEPKDRHEQQEQREDGKEHVVRDDGGERASSVVAELLDDAERETGDPMPLLERIDSPNDALDRVHS